MKEESEGCFNKVAILLVKISKTIDVSVGKEEEKKGRGGGGGGGG